MADVDAGGVAGGAASGAATGAAAGPWGALAGAVIGGAMSYFGQSSANAANAAMSDKATGANIDMALNQMRFQERMSNSQYQRAVADLKQAGLNPMMAYGNMHTSSPSGASGVAQQATMQNTLGESGRQVGDAAGKAMSAMVQEAQVKNMFEQNRLLNATTGKEMALERQATSQASLNDTAALKNEVDVLQGLAMTDYYKKLQSTTSAQAAHYRALTTGENFTNVGRAAESRMYERPGGEAVPYVKQVLPAVSSAVGGSILGSMLGGTFKFGRRKQ
jgi:hypothetical protein